MNGIRYDTALAAARRVVGLMGITDPFVLGKVLFAILDALYQAEGMSWPSAGREEAAGGR